MSDVTVEKRSQSTGWSLPAAIAAVCAFIVNLLFSDDWCFGALTALLLAAIVSAVFDVLARFLTKGRVNEVFRIVLWVVVGIGAGLTVRLTEAKAFRIVFETGPPEGVTGVVAERCYAGGPGDQVLLMQFSSDEANFEALIARRGLQEDSEVVRLWNEVFKEHKDIWEHVFGGLLPDDHRWHAFRAPPKPVVYRGGDGITPNIVVLWDGDGQVAYVLYSVG